MGNRDSDRSGNANPGHCINIRLVPILRQPVLLFWSDIIRNLHRNRHTDDNRRTQTAAINGRICSRSTNSLHRHNPNIFIFAIASKQKEMIYSNLLR